MMSYLNKNKLPLKKLFVGLAAIGLTGCLSNMPSLGGGSGNTVSGAAAGKTAEGNNSSLESCDESLGTLRLHEDQKLAWWRSYRRYYPNLGSTLPVIRMMVQQSNCFVVVERGQAMSAMTEERRLMNSGELRSGSNFGQGQMVAADYTLNPSVQFSKEGSSGMSGVFNKAINKGSSFLGGAGSFLRGGGKVDSNESSTTLLLIDNRSGVQVSSSVGSAKNYDFSLFGMSYGKGGFGKVSGFSDTPEGKVIIAAFADSYNQMVKALRNYKPQTVKGGLGKGGRLQVGGDDDQMPMAQPRSEPAPVVSKTVVVPSTQVASYSRVRKNSNLNVNIDAYDEDALEDYYESLKSSMQVLPAISNSTSAQLNASQGGMNVGASYWMIWSGIITGKMETSKIELESWPMNAKIEGWAVLGKRIEKYNKLFNKHRKAIVANKALEERLRTSVAEFELVTKESLLTE